MINMTDLTKAKQDIELIRKTVEGAAMPLLRQFDKDYPDLVISFRFGYSTTSTYTHAGEVKAYSPDMSFNVTLKTI